MDQQGIKRKRKENDQGDGPERIKKQITSADKPNQQPTVKETRPVRRPATRQIGPWSIRESLHPALRAYSDEQCRRLFPPLRVDHLTRVPPDDDVDSWFLPSVAVKFSGKSKEASSSFTASTASTALSASTASAVSAASTAPTALSASTASTGSTESEGRVQPPAKSAQRATATVDKPPATAISTASQETRSAQDEKLAEQQEQLLAQSVELQGCTQTISQLQQSIQELQKQKSEEVDAVKLAANRHFDQIQSQAAQEITSLQGDLASVKGEKVLVEQERDEIKGAFLQIQEEKAQMINHANQAYGTLQQQVAGLQQELSTARQENQVLQSSLDNATAGSNDVVLVNFLLRLIEKENPHQPGWSSLNAETIPADLVPAFQATLRFQQSISWLVSTVEGYYAAKSSSVPAAKATPPLETGSALQTVGTLKPTVQAPTAPLVGQSGEDPDLANNSCTTVEPTYVADPVPVVMEEIEHTSLVTRNSTYSSGPPASVADEGEMETEGGYRDPAEVKQRCRNGSSCHFLQKGTCHFYHPEEECNAQVKDPSDETHAVEGFVGASASTYRPPHKSLKKYNTVCRFGEACKWPGDTCPYQHPKRAAGGAMTPLPTADGYRPTTPEPRPTSPDYVPTSPQWSPVAAALCRYGSGCRKQHTTCRFHHPSDSQSGSGSVPPAVASSSLPTSMDPEASQEAQPKLCKAGLTNAGCQELDCLDSHSWDPECPISQGLVNDLTCELPDLKDCSPRDVMSRIAFLDPGKLPTNLAKENRELVVAAMEPHVSHAIHVLEKASKKSIEDARLDSEHFRTLGLRIGKWIDPSTRGTTFETLKIKGLSGFVVGLLLEVPELFNEKGIAKVEMKGNLDLADDEDNAPVAVRTNGAYDLDDDEDYMGQFDTVEPEDPGFQLKP